MFTSEVIEKISWRENYVYSLDIWVMTVQDKELLATTFVHKSYAADYTQPMAFNERLEFLWDGILGAIINKFLFLKYKNAPESKLTLYKIGLVREETLAQVARDIHLWGQLFLGKGEKKQDGDKKDSILSDALEALLGFLYLDAWIESVEAFIQKYIFTRIDDISQREGKSFKSLIQEHVQKKLKILPVYTTTAHETDTKWNVYLYKAVLSVQEELRGEWVAKNKKKAQEEAAKDAYNKKIEI